MAERSNLLRRLKEINEILAEASAHFAARQNVSLKYLERILPVLAKNGLIEGACGKGGGYRLCRFPYQYRVGEILRLTEGGLASVPYSKEEPDKKSVGRP